MPMNWHTPWSHPGAWLLKSLRYHLDFPFNPLANLRSRAALSAACCRLRAPDRPLRQAGMGDRRNRRRWDHRPDHASRRSIPRRSAILFISSAKASTGERDDPKVLICRPDVRPLRNAAARHGRSHDPGARRLRHRLDRRARGADLSTAASISTTSLTTSSSSRSSSAPTFISWRCASRPCRASPPPP